MTTKASDVLDLGRARDLLGCGPGTSLLDGVRALKAEARMLRGHLEAALADANALRELLLEEQALRHEYGSRLARVEAEAQRVPTVVAVSEGPTFVVVDTDGAP